MSGLSVFTLDSGQSEVTRGSIIPERSENDRNLKTLGYRDWNGPSPDSSTHTHFGYSGPVAHVRGRSYSDYTGPVFTFYNKHMETDYLALEGTFPVPSGTVV